MLARLVVPGAVIILPVTEVGVFTPVVGSEVVAEAKEEVTEGFSGDEVKEGLANSKLCWVVAGAGIFGSEDDAEGTSGRARSDWEAGSQGDKVNQSKVNSICRRGRLQ